MARVRKRARITAARAQKNELDREDYISLLPVEILFSILGYLSVKEAVATSTLSKKWQYLWTSARGLYFKSRDALNRIAANPSIVSSERSRYINWVNRILRQHIGETLDAFKIAFDLDKSSTYDINNWITFTMTKRVENLEVEFLHNGETLRQPSNNYTLPYTLLKNFTDSMGIIHFKVLVLKGVNLNDEALDCLLSSCPSLFFISIHGSGNLRNVKVSGFTIALKYLKITTCLGMESIEISNANLLSLRYVGSPINLTVSNVPKLDEVSIGMGYSGLENNVLGRLSCCLYQLKHLALNIRRPGEDYMTDIAAFPVLPNLKLLILRVGARDDDCLLGFTSLVKACPHLDKFVLQLVWVTPKARRRKLREAARSPHEFLKTVEISGYYGRISDAEIAMYFIQNAVALQRITIDPHTIIPHVGIKKREQHARKHARKHLESKTPSGVHLVIL